MAKKTNKSPSGTSFHGTTIVTTPETLKKLFPESFIEDVGGKTNLDFILETKDGDVFTIYDWKLYVSLTQNGIYSFNIGACNKLVAEQAKGEIFNLIKKTHKNG